jgi:hypothetical protein
MEAPHVSLLYLRGVVLFFRLKSAHRTCGVAPGVGMRVGQANEFLSKACVTWDSHILCHIGSTTRFASSK